MTSRQRRRGPAGDLFRTRLRKRLSSDENIMRMWHDKYEETARTYPACARILDHSAHVTHHVVIMRSPCVKAEDGRLLHVVTRRFPTMAEDEWK